MSLVECVALDGSIKQVQRDELILRPAVYAVIVRDDEVLLVSVRKTGKYHLPGGGIETGEKIEAALKREIREETGLEVEIEKLAHFKELFFYYDPSRTAYHGLHFYYICHPKTFTLLDVEQVKDDSAEQPRWVKIQALLPEDFQVHGDIVLELCKDIAGRIDCNDARKDYGETARSST